jgi:cysteine synthase A
MIRVPNAASFAAMHVLAELTGRRYGGSTGTNLYGACILLAEMAKHGRDGSLVTLICDSGELYRDTYYSPDWLERQGCDLQPYQQLVAGLLRAGDWRPLLAE